MLSTFDTMFRFMASGRVIKHFSTRYGLTDGDEYSWIGTQTDFNAIPDSCFVLLEKS